MMTKITENYLTTATLLRQEIAQLRSQQKNGLKWQKTMNKKSVFFLKNTITFWTLLTFCWNRRCRRK